MRILRKISTSYLQCASNEDGHGVRREKGFLAYAQDGERWPVSDRMIAGPAAERLILCTTRAYKQKKSNYLPEPCQIKAKKRKKITEETTSRKKG